MAEQPAASFEPLRIDFEGTGYEDSPWVADWKAFLERLHADPEFLLPQLTKRPGAPSISIESLERSLGALNISVKPHTEIDDGGFLPGMTLRTSDGRKAAVAIAKHSSRKSPIDFFIPDQMAYTGRVIANSNLSRKDNFVIGLFGHTVHTLKEDAIQAALERAYAPIKGDVSFEWLMRADFIITAPISMDPRTHYIGFTVVIGYRPHVERATLRNLFISGVGPADALEMAPLASRVNIITGDNGLGKTFLLDAIWWVLTGTWHKFAAVPSRPDARISGQVIGTRATQEVLGAWDPSEHSWQGNDSRPETNSLVIYMRVDGSFSVMDPRRNNRRFQRPDGSKSEMPRAFQFSAQEALEGLEIQTDQGLGSKQKVCMGLIHDWVDWQQTNDPRFRFLTKVLSLLGAEGEPLVPGDPAQPFLPVLDRKYPTVKMKYDQEVPIVYAPAGIQRVCILAYLLAWSFAVPKGKKALEEWTPVGRVALLVDEIETHLHPRWQRTILPSLIGAIEDLNNAVGPNADDLHCDAQVFVATHSPLVLASMEPRFDNTLDALWKLELVTRSMEVLREGKMVAIDVPEVQLARQEWYKRGDVTAWLTSLFDLFNARSFEADIAIREAMQLVTQKDPDVEQIRRLTAELHRVLPETDRLWVRWAEFAEKHGVNT